MTTAPDTATRRTAPGFAATGLLAVAAAVAATTLAAALARAAGVDLEVSGEDIPVSGVAFMTGVLSLVGVLLALALRRWSTRPAERFALTACTLTALSLVPPFLADADAATTLTLVGLHLLAAAVVIPALTRTLCTPAAPRL
ncbi:DUF6069 family protein [Nocardioides sp. SYSU D00038]|uniref:DUF6069 family protein n=1 Tax=Nocardioides sp. SYSU D00038 TaxID=2812554 RepID=UPI00196744C5|nr:DUF6069 family protein [Nocardioides sp. SYSU D00038]